MSTENKKKPATSDLKAGNPQESWQKSERLVDRYIPIRLYPVIESSKADEETKELKVTLVINHTVSHNNKTNLLELMFTKIDLLAGNAEEYCHLVKRLKSKKWSQEDPKKLLFWTRARDSFSNCISTKLKYAFEVALKQIMSRVHELYTARYARNPYKQKQSEVDKCLFYRGKTMYVLHSDDSLLAGPDQNKMDQIMK